MPLIRKTLHTSVVRSAIQTSMEEVFWKKKKKRAFSVDWRLKTIVLSLTVLILSLFT